MTAYIHQAMVASLPLHREASELKHGTGLSKKEQAHLCWVVLIRLLRLTNRCFKPVFCQNLLHLPNQILQDRSQHPHVIQCAVQSWRPPYRFHEYRRHLTWNTAGQQFYPRHVI